MQGFSNPFPLSFIPKALPDEIFGSWLGRLAVTNGISTKPVFLRWLGVPKRLRRIVLADIISPSESTLHILSILDLTYLECLSRFSTRPYWECMHAWEGNCEKGGTNAADQPALLNFGRGSRKSSKDLNQAFLRACPACLYDDWKVLGSCYFHRSHQLRGSRVCHKHGLYLISNCPACTTPLGDVRNLLLIYPNCRCGADLTDARHFGVNEKKMDIWWRLAIFEHMCLHSERGALAGPRLLGYLRQQLRVNYPGSGRHGGQRALEHAFGEDGANWIRRTSRRQIGATSRTSNLSLTNATVAVYAALFTACGISFEMALGEVSAFNPGAVEEIKPIWQRNPRPATVEGARQRFLEFFADKKAIGWKAIRSARPFVFWLLALEDFPWLQRQLPERSKGLVELIPSIESDRILLTCDVDLALKFRLTRKLHEAAIRALYRDTAWLESTIMSSRDKRNAESRTNLVRRLDLARTEHCERTERPKRFRRRDAARGLNTSVKTLLSQAAKYRIPDSLIEEDLWVFRHRALEWAVKKRLAEGLSLAPSMVRELAGISALVSTKQVAELIEEIRRKLLDK